MSDPESRPSDINQLLRDQILHLINESGTGKTISPSDVARAVRPDDWRPLLKRVRQAAILLADSGDISIYRKGKPVPTDRVRGVIRLGLPAPR